MGYNPKVCWGMLVLTICIIHEMSIYTIDVALSCGPIMWIFFGWPVTGKSAISYCTVLCPLETWRVLHFFFYVIWPGQFWTKRRVLQMNTNWANCVAYRVNACPIFLFFQDLLHWKWTTDQSNLSQLQMDMPKNVSAVCVSMRMVNVSVQKK